jgi:hypothetical protein
MPLSEIEISLSLQRALLDKITCNLRTVSFKTVGETIFLYFYYDEKASEVEHELSEDVSAEVIADFYEQNKINCIISDIKFPKKIEAEGRIIYSRFE